MNKSKDYFCDKIEQDLGMPGLSNILAWQPLGKVTPVFIRAYRERVAGILGKDLLNTFIEKQNFFSPSTIDQRELLQLQQIFYSSLPKNFSGIELSPISPLGVNSVLSSVSQDNTLSTIRGSEVVSDPTTALVIECANRRKNFIIKSSNKNQIVDLATSHRVLRMQKFDYNKGYMQHFLLFGLCSGGKEKLEDTFIVNNIIKHIQTWLDLIDNLNKEPYYLKNITVKLSDIPTMETLIANAGIERKQANRNSFNEDYDLFDNFHVNFPKELASLKNLSDCDIERYRLHKYLKNLTLIEDNIISTLKLKYPHVNFVLDFNRKAGLGYYDKTCFHIYASNKDGQEIPLADGGSVDRLKKILNSKKEYAITSGFGAELLHKLFLNK